MSHHHSGRKIKRSKNLYGSRRRSKIRSVLTIVFLIVAVGALVFIGYSLGKPLVDYWLNKEDVTSSEAPWSPADVESSSIADSSQGEIGSQGDDVIDGDNDASLPLQGGINGSQVFLSVSDLASSEALSTAVAATKASGSKEVVVPCKLPGGQLSYVSAVPLAIESGAVSSGNVLTAADICRIITDSGLVPVAEVNVLTDHILPRFDKSCSYTLQGQSSAWYDNDPGAGGKLWLSPFSDSAKAYLNALAGELYDAGFSYIVCSDLIFPPFRNSDLNYVGDIVKQPTRYQALINVVGQFHQSAQEKGRGLVIQVPAKGVAEGTSEVFHPDELIGIKGLIYYSVSELGGNIAGVDLSGMGMYDMATTVFQKVREQSKDMEIIPCLVRENLSAEEIVEIERAFVDMGFEHWFTR